MRGRALRPFMPRSAPVLLTLCSCLFAAPALAGPAEAAPENQSQVRYERSGPAATPKAQTDVLDRRLEQAKQKQQRENEAIEQARAGDFTRRHQEAREQQMVDDQIGLLIKLIKATDADDLEMADLLFRLADLYLEKKAYYDLQAGALYEPIAEAEEEAKASH
jgi:hypothetical protein